MFVLCYLCIRIIHLTLVKYESLHLETKEQWICYVDNFALVIVLVGN